MANGSNGLSMMNRVATFFFWVSSKTKFLKKSGVQEMNPSFQKVRPNMVVGNDKGSWSEQGYIRYSKKFCEGITRRALQLGLGTCDNLKFLRRGHRFQGNGSRDAWRRTICVCDELETYDQVRKVKAGNEMTNFGDVKRFLSETLVILT